MVDETAWLLASDLHLEAAVAWLRLRLVHFSQSFQSPDPSKPLVTDEEVDAAAATLASLADSDPPPTLVLISQLFRLTQFELNTLLLCTAMELDTRISGLCALAQDDPNRPYPTFALALSLFDNPSWAVLASDRPLRHWQLIEINQRQAQPLTTSPLRADERIVNYLKGLNVLDDRLTPFLIPFEQLKRGAELPPSQQATVQSIIQRLNQLATETSLPVIQLLGTDRANKQLIAKHVADRLGVTLYHLPARLLPGHTTEIEELSRLWQRESFMQPVALFLDTLDVAELDTNENLAPLLNRFLRRSSGLFFLDSRDLWSGLDSTTIYFDIGKPTPAEQQAVWAAALGHVDGEIPALLAGQFNLSVNTIEEITSDVLQDGANPGVTADALWQACLVHTRPQLDLLAQRLQPKATWADIVLPVDQLNLIQQIADQVRQQGIVYEEWGFRQKLNRGLGIMALFAGESGTGKTMAAEVIANELALNLYRIDLSGVVSKYIGETEKNLRRLFDAAEDGGAILFFDEADALFGKRSQVKDSHDRYANIEINYLLQRMEAYQGLAILSTNQRSNLDDAFVRRLRFIVKFPFPDENDRSRIWQHIFPEQLPLEELDYKRLADFKLTGGSINNIALNAAFLAAKERSPVKMAHILWATRAEFLKMDRLIDERDFDRDLD